MASLVSLPELKRPIQHQAPRQVRLELRYTFCADEGSTQASCLLLDWSGSVVKRVGCRRSSTTSLSDALLPARPRQSRRLIDTVIIKRLMWRRAQEENHQSALLFHRQEAGLWSPYIDLPFVRPFASSSAHAQNAPQLVVLGVDVDYTGAKLHINGENFTNGSSPVIKLAYVLLFAELSR